jgi:carbon monoxide dehydrogenase subunit G
MIEHELSIGIEAPTDQVWAYVSKMANWAANMPGYREFEMIDEANSRWTLKVGVAGLVRTVNVLVRIDLWDGPGHVAFTYRLDNDPVDGAGTYRAQVRPDGGTDIVLAFTINGQGPMAPAWEALAKPILPKLARGFAEKLKCSIEEISKASGDLLVDQVARADGSSSFWRRFGIGGRRGGMAK